MEQYGKLTPELLEALRDAVPGGVSAGSDIKEKFSHDEMVIYGKVMPDAVVEAETTEEVAAVMKFCNAHRIPVTPRGSGSGLVGGAVPAQGGVLLSMTKMNRILSYDTENMVVRVQAGVRLYDLAKDAEKQGLLYPPDPGEKFATLGGNVSTNAGGMRAVKYGTTRDYVRAMTVVLPTGEIIHLGSPVSKTSSGYSLLNLMIGSEGTLGIITELLLKVIPAPKAAVSMIALYADLDACIASVPRLVRSGLEPQTLEFMERDIVQMSEAFRHKDTFQRIFEGADGNAYLLVTFDGNDEESVRRTMEKASEIMKEAGALDVVILDDPKQKNDAWATRSYLLGCIKVNAKLLDESDVVVPVNEIAHYVDFIKEIAKDYDFDVKSFGHAGDGNLHIYNISNDMEEDVFKSQVASFMERAYDKAVELGGQVSGEHGIGRGKVRYLSRMVGPVNMRLMKGIKEVFDPNMVLNPGKVCYAQEDRG